MDVRLRCPQCGNVWFVPAALLDPYGQQLAQAQAETSSVLRHRRRRGKRQVRQLTGPAQVAAVQARRCVQCGATGVDEPMAVNPGPGWFQDPSGRFESRWWDGTAWSERVRSSFGSEAVDPPPAP